MKLQFIPYDFTSSVEMKKMKKYLLGNIFDLII